MKVWEALKEINEENPVNNCLGKNTTNKGSLMDHNETDSIMENTVSIQDQRTDATLVNGGSENKLPTDKTLEDLDDLLISNGYEKYFSYNIFYSSRDLWLSWLHKDCWDSIQEDANREMEDIQCGYT